MNYGRREKSTKYKRKFYLIIERFNKFVRRTLSFIYLVLFLPFVLSFRYITVPHFPSYDFTLRFFYSAKSIAPSAVTESVNFSKRMAVHVAGERMKTNDLTRPSRRTRWNATAPAGKTRFIRCKTRYATWLILSATDSAVGPFFFTEFSFRIQQERGKTAVRRVACGRGHIDLGASTLQAMNSEKLVGVQ